MSSSPKRYRKFRRAFDTFLKVFPYLFIGGLIAMILGDMILGDKAWGIIYSVAVFPAIVTWLLGTGIGCLWWLILRSSASKEPGIVSVHGGVLLIVGLVFTASGLWFLVARIS